MPIVGTAGHVDHGKSTLVKALTGDDPDRWDEEKRRGLTIDLGFASTDIDGIEFGFVDVPGHERFIKNMLAGVVGVDCALLVVAADSGWMPQTEEHVRVLDLVGPDKGVIALTRIELVNPDILELAELEIVEEVAGTSLSGWPIVAVSAVTGDGLDELRSALATIGRSVEHDPSEPFRLWVDRSFVIHGSGTVVTGTVQRGSIGIDDTVEIQPLGISARVRGLHRHDRAVDSVEVGQRAAINLRGVEVDHVDRGSLLASPGTSMSTRRLLVSARSTRGFDTIPPKGAFHIHTGTADRAVAIRRLDESVFLVTMEEPVPAICCDRIIIRESGRQAVVGGGPIVDPDPPAGRVSGPVPDPDSTESMANQLMAARGIVRTDEIRRATGGSIPTSGNTVGSWILSDAYKTQAETSMASAARSYHEDHPRRPGIPIAELSGRLGLDHEVATWIVEQASNMVLDNGVVSDISFSESLSPSDQTLVDAAINRLNGSFDVPRASQLGLEQDLLQAIIRRGDVVRIESDLVFTPLQIEEITVRIADLPDGFTVSEFKDHFGMARRQSVPLLEWLDKKGITRRDGDGRTVRGG